MAVNVERSCTMLVHFDKAASASEIRAALEGNDALAKVQAMQKAIMMLLNGEPLPALFITIVRYVLPSEDHTVQKLLLLYLVSTLFSSHWHSVLNVRLYGQTIRLGRSLKASVTVTQYLLCLQETIEKTDSGGKLLPEMVSVWSYISHLPLELFRTVNNILTRFMLIVTVNNPAHSDSQQHSHSLRACRF